MFVVCRYITCIWQLQRSLFQNVGDTLLLTDGIIFSKQNSLFNMREGVSPITHDNFTLSLTLKENIIIIKITVNDFDIEAPLQFVLFPMNNDISPTWRARHFTRQQKHQYQGGEKPTIKQMINVNTYMKKEHYKL